MRGSRAMSLFYANNFFNVNIHHSGHPGKSHSSHFNSCKELRDKTVRMTLVHTGRHILIWQHHKLPTLPSLCFSPFLKFQVARLLYSALLFPVCFPASVSSLTGHPVLLGECLFSVKSRQAAPSLCCFPQPELAASPHQGRDSVVPL